MSKLFCAKENQTKMIKHIWEHFEKVQSLIFKFFFLDFDIIAFHPLFSFLWTLQCTLLDS